jgi:hypothetical protein
MAPRDCKALDKKYLVFRVTAQGWQAVRRARVLSVSAGASRGFVSGQDGPGPMEMSTNADSPPLKEPTAF